MKTIMMMMLLAFNISASAALKGFNAAVDSNAEAKQMEAARKATGCFFPNLTLPKDFDVYAAGAYRGKPIDFQIDQSGNQAGQINVAVNNPNKPVALYLGAYDPTIWNIGWTKGTNIIAVFATGNHRQVIAGLPNHVPQLISTYDNRGKCGLNNINEEDPVAPNDTSRILFGRNVNQVFPAKNGVVVVGSSISNTAELIRNDAVTPTSFYDPKAPLAGVAGLHQAAQEGILRKATPRDVEVWKIKTGKTVRFDYVILKPFAYPAGLHGAHSKNFLLAKNVQPPTGNPGHSPLYDINTLQCIGATCGYDE